MARGKKTGGRDLRKGQVLNPLGARAHNPEMKQVKQARMANALDFEKAVYKFMNLSLAELKSEYTNPKSSGVELAIIKILIKSIEQGDPSKLDFLLERTIGKVKEKVEHSVANPYDGMTDEQLDYKIKKLESPTLAQQIEIRDVTPTLEKDREDKSS